jgi:hypothetical protein
MSLWHGAIYAYSYSHCHSTHRGCIPCGLCRSCRYGEITSRNPQGARTAPCCAKSFASGARCCTVAPRPCARVQRQCHGYVGNGVAHYGVPDAYGYCEKAAATMVGVCVFRRGCLCGVAVLVEGCGDGDGWCGLAVRVIGQVSPGRGPGMSKPRRLPEKRSHGGGSSLQRSSSTHHMKACIVQNG